MGFFLLNLSVDEVRIITKGKDSYDVEVNLETQTVTGEDGVVYSFDIDPYQKKCF